MQPRLFVIAWVFAAAAILAAGPAAAAADVPSLLREADLARTSDRERFLELLGELETRRAEATPAQVSHLEYLEAMRKMVYGGDPEGALRDLDRLSREAGDEVLRYRSTMLAASTSAMLKRYPEALRYVNQVLAQRHSIKDRVIRYDGVSAAATIHMMLGESRIALGYAEEVLSSDPTPRQVCLASFDRTVALDALDLLHDDGKITEVAARCEAVKEPIATLYMHLLRAKRLLARERADEAGGIVSARMAQVERVGYSVLRADYLQLLAEIRKQAGDLAGATAAAREVAGLGPTAGPHTASRAHRILYEAALARGDDAAALGHYRDYADADRKWLDEVQAREMAYQIVRQEMHQKSQQLDLANRENDVLQLRQRVQQQSAQNDRLVMLLLLLLLLSVGAWAWRTRRIHASLRRLAETDMLTGICNRRHFTIRAEQLLAQAARGGDEAALVMFDLDHFKLVNDRFGHDTGDWVLRRVAEACRAECGPADVFGRLGGEEFAILLANATTRDARRVAEGCRLRLAGIDTAETGHAFRVTASFGASGSALSGHDLARLMSHADKMLYRAKREGRNRVFAYEVTEPVVIQVGELAVPESPPAAKQAPPRRAAAS